ncbi:hypothetical protein OG207_01530 [Streptomyces sp. NBC_01439]|nr:hypothetical protein [Streptomyces sp. NBC_01439]
MQRFDGRVLRLSGFHADPSHCFAHVQFSSDRQRLEGRGVGYHGYAEGHLLAAHRDLTPREVEHVANGPQLRNVVPRETRRVCHDIEAAVASSDETFLLP